MPRLTDLPSELISLISSHLCSYCSRVNSIESARSLSRLARTARLLHAPATKHLYEEISIKSTEQKDRLLYDQLMTGEQRCRSLRCHFDHGRDICNDLVPVLLRQNDVEDLAIQFWHAIPWSPEILRQCAQHFGLLRYLSLAICLPGLDVSWLNVFLQQRRLVTLSLLGCFKFPKTGAVFESIKTIIHHPFDYSCSLRQLISACPNLCDLRFEVDVGFERCFSGLESLENLTLGVSRELPNLSGYGIIDRLVLQSLKNDCDCDGSLVLPQEVKCLLVRASPKWEAQILKAIAASPVCKPKVVKVDWQPTNSFAEKILAHDIELVEIDFAVSRSRVLGGNDPDSSRRLPAGHLV